VSEKPFDHRPEHPATVHALQAAAIGNSWMRAAREAGQARAGEIRAYAAGAGARSYVTEVCWPEPGDGAVRGHVPMRQPGPEPEAGA